MVVSRGPPRVVVPRRRRLIVPGRRPDRRRRPVTRRVPSGRSVSGAGAEGEDAEEDEQRPPPHRKRRPRRRWRCWRRLRAARPPRLVPEHRGVAPPRRAPPGGGVFVARGNQRGLQWRRRPAGEARPATAAEVRLPGEALVAPRTPHRAGHDPPPFAPRPLPRLHPAGTVGDYTPPIAVRSREGWATVHRHDRRRWWSPAAQITTNLRSPLRLWGHPRHRH